MKGDCFLPITNFLAHLSTSIDFEMLGLTTDFTSAFISVLPSIIQGKYRSFLEIMLIELPEADLLYVLDFLLALFHSHHHFLLDTEAIRAITGNLDKVSEIIQ
jgi:hypothetical protein